jgi:Holliday junction DNA helicase RuvA
VIGWLSGVVRAQRADGILVDVGGVGYLVGVAGSALGQAEVGEAIELHIYTQVREDTLALYGFSDAASLDTFHTLISVSGVGPKMASNILGSMSPSDLQTSIEMADLVRLKTLPGVGKRLAERLAVELRGKLKGDYEGSEPSVSVVATGIWADIASALLNLDFRRKEIDGALQELRISHPDGEFDALFREALKRLRR